MCNHKKVYKKCPCVEALTIPLLAPIMKNKESCVAWKHVSDMKSSTDQIAYRIQHFYPYNS